jgi:hypothetical protein
MKIPVKFYTDVTGKTVGDIIKIAGKRGYLELVGNRQYIVEVI